MISETRRCAHRWALRLARRGVVDVEDTPSGNARKRDSLLVASIFLAYAFIRVGLLRTPINSDEPQHAHVAWAWSQGLVPYRDVFDNHAPLFHMLYAPIIGLIGETPDILIWLRLAIIPFSVLALGLAFWIARALWDRQAATWAILFILACPPYLYIAGQFRTDVLWATAWIAVIAVAVLGRWSHWRALAVGLAIGIAFAISLKTALLVAGLALAWLMNHFGMPVDSRPKAKQAATAALLIMIGSLPVPALVVAVVAAKGGLAAMRYDVLQHNLLHGLQHVGVAWHRAAWIACLAALLMGMLARQRRDCSSPLLRARRDLVLGSALVYGLLLLGTWPLVTRQDLLPALPLLAVGLAGWWSTVAVGARNALPPVLATVGLAIMLIQHPPWRNDTSGYRQSLERVLAMTGPPDDVLDDKGASIYRQRPFYYALESITLERLRRGLIDDDITERTLRTDTHVVWALRLPAIDRRFVARHYLPLGNSLRVAGFALGSIPAGASRSIEVLLPGEYSLIDGDHAADGRFDDGANMATQRLAAGSHTLQVSRTGNYLLVWQPAAPLFEAAKHL